MIIDMAIFAAAGFLIAGTTGIAVGVIAGFVFNAAVTAWKETRR